jgi:hypothetical protein
MSNHQLSRVELSMINNCAWSLERIEVIPSGWVIEHADFCHTCILLMATTANGFSLQASSSASTWIHFGRLLVMFEDGFSLSLNPTAYFSYRRTNTNDPLLKIRVPSSIPCPETFLALKYG